MTETLQRPKQKRPSVTHPTARVLIPARDLGDRVRWLKARQQGVTATDSRRLMGHGYASEDTGAYGVYLDKVTEVDDAEADEIPAEVSWELGSDLEPVITKHARRHLGLGMSKVGMLQHVDNPHWLSSPDRNTSDGAHAELKYTSTHYLRAYQERGSVWTNEDGWTLPDAWRVQLQHQLMVSGRDHAYLCALIGDRRRFTYWVVDADPIEQEAIGAVADRFWSYVALGDPPPIDWDRVTAAEMKLRYPEAVFEGRTVEGDELAEVIRWIKRRDELKAEAKRVDDDLAFAENHLRAHHGPAAKLFAPGDSLKPLSSYPVMTAVTYGAKAMAEEHAIDLAPYTKKTLYRKFTQTRDLNKYPLVSLVKKPVRKTRKAS